MKLLKYISDAINNSFGCEKKTTTRTEEKHHFKKCHNLKDVRRTAVHTAMTVQPAASFFWWMPTQFFSQILADFMYTKACKKTASSREEKKRIMEARRVAATRAAAEAAQQELTRLLARRQRIEDIEMIRERNMLEEIARQAEEEERQRYRIAQHEELMVWVRARDMLLNRGRENDDCGYESESEHRDYDDIDYYDTDESDYDDSDDSDSDDSDDSGYDDDDDDGFESN